MATLQERNGSYRVLFRHGGRRHTFTIGKVEPREADLVAADVDRVLLRIEQRLLKVPPGVDLVAFIRAGGQVPEPEAAPAPEPLRLRQLRDRYLATHEGGAMEKNSLATVRIHLVHIEATLGARAVLPSLGPADLQRHVDRRRTMKGNGGRAVSPTTIRKELASFRAAWNWALHLGLLDRPFPGRGLVFPKVDEKPPFRTYAEIERLIREGGQGEAEQPGLWDGLFLTLPEVVELLEHVRARALHPWIHPMFALAAHTGARRVEHRGAVHSSARQGFCDWIREIVRQHPGAIPKLADSLATLGQENTIGAELVASLGDVGEENPGVVRLLEPLFDRENGWVRCAAIAIISQTCSCSVYAILPQLVTAAVEARVARHYIDPGYESTAYRYTVDNTELDYSVAEGFHLTLNRVTQETIEAAVATQGAAGIELVVAAIRCSLRTSPGRSSSRS